MKTRVVIKGSVSLGALVFAVFLLPSPLLSIRISAQTETNLDENDSDPMKLFERGQNAHAQNKLDVALEFYEAALKLRPEFPEAEFQRGNALVSLKRIDEAVGAFRRAIELRPNWSLPYSSLGVAYVRLNRDREAESPLRQALKLDPSDPIALRVLADIRLRAGDAKEALELSRKATSRTDAPAASWLVQALAERSLGAKADAATSLDHVLASDSNNVLALLERAELEIEDKNIEAAVNHLQTVEKQNISDKGIASRLAQDYERTGKTEDAQRVAMKAGLTSNAPGEKNKAGVIGSPEEIEAANNEDPAIARKALTSLLEKNPRSAMLLARLGNSYRTDDPAQSLDYYRRAVQIEPNNADYATGYASALVQSHNFADAITILRRVLSVTPDNYAAHANLATALYKQKLYSEALSEYSWILEKRPELSITYYFVATAHDYLGEYPEALAAYETFISRADAQANQLEIDKVKLRLPMLRRQIQLHQGAKRKPSK